MRRQTWPREVIEIAGDGDRDIEFSGQLVRRSRRLQGDAAGLRTRMSMGRSLFVSRRPAPRSKASGNPNSARSRSQFSESNGQGSSIQSIHERSSPSSAKSECRKPLTSSSESLSLKSNRTCRPLDFSDGNTRANSAISTAGDCPNFIFRMLNPIARSSSSLDSAMAPTLESLQRA